jgi:hypothetical protein
MSCYGNQITTTENTCALCIFTVFSQANDRMGYVVIDRYRPGNGEVECCYVSQLRLTASGFYLNFYCLNNDDFVLSFFLAPLRVFRFKSALNILRLHD